MKENDDESINLSKLSDNLKEKGSPKEKLEMDDEDEEMVPYFSDEEAPDNEDAEEEMNEYLQTLNDKVGTVIDTIMRAHNVFSQLNTS